jgi:hypothetical protein
MERGDTVLKDVEAPESTHVLSFFLGQDQAIATCLWQSPSVFNVQQYVDATLGDASINTCFEVDKEQSIGLPSPVVP